MSTVNAVGVLREEVMNIPLGRVTGTSSEHKFGANAAVGNAAREDIWSVGGVYPWPTAAETVRIKVGGNAADTAAGDGARSVIVIGLDENFDIAQETIVTAGASASSATTTTFFRVYRVFVETSGTYTEANTGIVTIENTTSTDVLAEIQAGYGQSQMTQYTVAKDMKALLYLPSVTIGSNQLSNTRMCQRQNIDTVAAPFAPRRVLFEVDAFVGSRTFLDAFPIVIPEKTDIWADGLAAAASASINFSYSLLLIDD